MHHRERLQMATPLLRDSKYVLLHSPPRHLPGSELFPGDSSTDVLFEWGKHKVALGAIIQY